MNPAVDLAIPDNGTLADYEQIIADNLLAFVRVGISLQRIRDGRLFEEIVDEAGKPLTWTVYLRTRWHKLSNSDKGLSRAHAGRMINGAEAYQLLAETFSEDQLPPNERAFRPFVSLDVPIEAKIALWSIINQTAPAGVVTGKHIELVVGVMKEVVITGAIEDGDGGQVHVSQALKAQITKTVFEAYKSERSYMDTVASTPLYSGFALVTGVEGARVTLELQAEPDALTDGQMVRLLVNEMRG